MLNGKPGVAPATRRRVVAALDVLGYERPVRLHQRSAGPVGLVIPELTNPIFPAFAQVIGQVLAGHGYTPVLCTQMPGGSTEDELEDVSVIGFDDSPLIAFTDPPLTTVRQPVHAMATAAVGSLLEEVGGTPVQRTEFVFQPELVVRASTARWNG